MNTFDPSILTDEDRERALRILGGDAEWLENPTKNGLVIAPDNNPYLYRWMIINGKRDGIGAAVYFHIQVADDPERPLHDHPWDNFSVILSGGYIEKMCMEAALPTERNTYTFHRHPGAVIFRQAAWSHRLFLPKQIYPYTMTLFSTGPKIRDWGFWYETGWVPYWDVTRNIDGKSVHVKGGM